MIKKTGIAYCYLYSAPLLAGVYGIMNEQLTYSISAEYFTNQIPAITQSMNI
jgi:hypothetical protein